MTYYTILKTKHVGDMVFTANDTDLIGLYCVKNGGAPGIRKNWVRKPKQPILDEAVQQMKEYLAGRRKEFAIPMTVDGTEFQEKIWTYTMRVPYGKTVSYSELAKIAGIPGAIRATGSALAQTPIDIIIPAHRVIAKDGGLGGFPGDRKRKMYLLDFEKMYSQ
jgi:methylated-DNA-[protein]-cysteine S-methyltransferase